MNPALILAAADAFRRCAEAAAGADERDRWYVLADQARCVYEAARDPGNGRLATTNGSGRVIGEHHHRARLTDRDVELIHELREAALTYSQIAAKFEVSRSTVAAICSGRRRSSMVMGHRLLPAREPMRWAASVDEFEVVST